MTLSYAHQSRLGDEMKTLSSRLPQADWNAWSVPDDVSILRIENGNEGNAVYRYHMENNCDL